MVTVTLTVLHLARTVPGLRVTCCQTESSGDEASLDGDSDSDSGDSLVPYSFEPTESNSDSEASSGDGSDSDDDERLSSLTW